MNQTSGSKSVTAFLQPLKQNSQSIRQKRKMKFQKKLPSSSHGKFIYLSHISWVGLHKLRTNSTEEWPTADHYTSRGYYITSQLRWSIFQVFISVSLMAQMLFYLLPQAFSILFGKSTSFQTSLHHRGQSWNVNLLPQVRPMALDHTDVIEKYMLYQMQRLAL